MAKYVQPNFIVDSSASFLRNVTFDSSVYLQGVTHINTPAGVSSPTPYALVLESGSGTDLQVKSVQLGTMAFQTAAAWDSSLSVIRTDINNLETSVGALDTLTQSHTAELAVHEASLGAIDTSLGQLDTAISGISTAIDNLETSVGALDTLTQGHTALLAVHEASLGAIDTSLGQIDTALDGKVSVAGDTMTGLLTLAVEGFTLDGQNITAIDTSTDGLGQLDTAIPTSGAVSKAIAAAIVAGVTASNGLTEDPQGNIKLGGTLSEATTIDISTHSLALANLVSGTGLLSVISDGGVLKTQQLLTMALESSANYYYASQVDTLVSDLSTLIDTRIDGIDANIIQIEASISRIDASLNDVIDIFEVIDASFAAVWTAIDNLETSVGALDTLTQGHTTAIDNLETSVGALDTLTQGHTALLAVHESSIGFLWSYDQIQDASIALAIAGTTTAYNGLTLSDDNSIGLGGALIQPTVITASAANTLTIAGLQTSTVDTPLALVQDTVDTSIRVRQLGTMAWATATDYTLKTLFDSSIAAIWTEFGYVDSSLADVWTKFGYVDTSLGILNDWNVSQDASIVALRSTTLSALQTASNGLTASDTSVILGGALTKDTDIDATGYDFSITGGLSIYGTLTVDGSVTYVNSVDLNVSDNIITVNYGETGAGVSKGFAGLKVDRGTADDYVLVFSEATDTFRIGIANESGLPTGTQAVATREDTPVSWGVGFWNGTEFRIDTSAGFTFTPGVGLGLPIATNMGTEATALMWDGTTVGSRELGTNAFSSTAYVPQTLFDTSIAAIWTKLGHVDTSLGVLEGLINTNATDIGYLESSVGALDLLTQSHTQSITDLSTGKLDAVANTTGVTGSATLYSGEANNVAYIKQLVAGTGATITEDSSTVTIAVTGASGYMSKYTGTFDGTSGTSFTVPVETHGLGTGPFTIAVYDAGERVYVGEEFNGSGDITFTWTSGSLSASCSYIISG